MAIVPSPSNQAAEWNCDYGTTTTFVASTRELWKHSPPCRMISANAAIFYYLFDVLVLVGEDVRSQSLEARRALLEARVLSVLHEPIRNSPELDASLPDLIASVRAQGLEGLVAKRRDSAYEAGQRSGAWQKMRINRGQEFVIGGYTIGGRTFDALVFGYFDGPRLVYVARTRNGFTPKLREDLFGRFRNLE